MKQISVTTSYNIPGWWRDKGCTCEVCGKKVNQVVQVLDKNGKAKTKFICADCLEKAVTFFLKGTK